MMMRMTLSGNFASGSFHSGRPTALLDVYQRLASFEPGMTDFKQRLFAAEPNGWTPMTTG